LKAGTITRAIGGNFHDETGGRPWALGKTVAPSEPVPEPACCGIFRVFAQRNLQCDGRWMDLPERTAEQMSDPVARDVVAGRSETAGRDDKVRTRERFPHRLLDHCMNRPRPWRVTT
jgi:hypothetical protein